MACSALLPRTRLYCSNCGENVGTERITSLICSQKPGGSVSLPVFLSSAARRAHGSSAEHAMRDLIASHAPLREGSHKARQNGPNHYPRGFKGIANRGPAKAQRSGFGGERRSSGTTELLPLKAKRRMWSLRRRGTPFSSIFRRAAKDGATGGRWSRRAARKNVNPIPLPAPTAIKQNGSYGAHLHLRNCPFFICPAGTPFLFSILSYLLSTH